MVGKEQDEAALGHAADAGVALVGCIGPSLAAALAGDLRNGLMLPATSDPTSHCQGPKGKSTEVPLRVDVPQTPVATSQWVGGNNTASSSPPATRFWTMPDGRPFKVSVCRGGGWKQPCLQPWL